MEPFTLKGLTERHHITLYTTSALSRAGKQQRDIHKYDEACRNLDLDQIKALSQRVIDNLNEELGLE
jgi:hypothetical protein